MGRNTANEDVRSFLKRNGITHADIAKKLNKTGPCITIWLSKELTDQKKALIYSTAMQCYKEKYGNDCSKLIS